MSYHAAIVSWGTVISEKCASMDHCFQYASSLGCASQSRKYGASDLSVTGTPPSARSLKSAYEPRGSCHMPLVAFVRLLTSRLNVFPARPEVQDSLNHCSNAPP